MIWLLPAIVILLVLSVLIHLIETGWLRRTCQGARARLRRAPRGQVVVFSMLLAWAIAYGGSKPSGQSSTPPARPTASNTLGVAATSSAPDSRSSSTANLARRDFPETPFVTPAGLPRWPFDVFTSNAIVGMGAVAQPPIPDVMLATGLALHRVATNQTLLTDEGGVSVYDWTRHGADNRAVWVITPFPVVIGTASYTRVGILSNGRLAFGYGTYHRRTAAGLPIDTPYPVVTVVPLWGPFALLPTASRVWARPEGTNAFVVAWEAMLLDGNETCPATAQCLIGRDGTFRFLYGPQPVGTGNLTTVGVQNQGNGWCYSNSHSNRVQEAMAVSLRPAALDGWAEADPDGDSISNYEEFMLGTDPALADSDADGPSDRWELEHGFDPTVAQLADPDVDTDGDLIPDGLEAWMGSDPNNPSSGRWDCVDDDGDGFVAWYENLVFYTSDAQADAPGPADADHVDLIARVDSTRPCILSLTGSDQNVDIPWVPGVSPESLRLRLSRGKPYQVILSRAPAGSGLSTNGFWWANVRFEAPPEFGGLNGPETVVGGTLAYNAHTVHIETPFRSAYDLWRNPGTTCSPLFDLTALRLRIDGPLIFCHNTTVGEISLTTNSLVTGPVDWIGLPPVTPAQANPLVFDPSTVTPGAYTVIATDAGNPWGWATCQVEIHALAFAESVVWLSASDTNTHTLALAPGSFPTSGLHVWSEPAGITSLDITPSEIDPGSYTVYAWGKCGGDEVQVNILSVEFKELWETSNRVNQVFNPTPKDDPPPTLSNRLYTVECPADGQFHVTLDVDDQPTSMRSKLMWAVYDGSTKLAENFFPATGPADIVFNHPAAKQDDLTDFELKCGWDIDADSSLDTSEILGQLVVTTAAGQAIGPPMVKGASTVKYADAVDYIDNAFLDPFIAHSKALLHIFLDGDTSSVSASKQPTQTNTVNFNCYSDPFCVWLTHNAGAPFNAAGTAQIQYYTWGTNTSLADKTCRYYQMINAAQSHYQTNVLPIANAFFATNPVNTIATFPLCGPVYDVPHSNESPAWVDAYLSGVTVNFDDPGLAWYFDDIGGTIGRGRILSHSATYTIEKKQNIWGVVYLKVIHAHFAGAVEDLYDFNAEDQGAGGHAAIIQLGHGNGGYEPGRSSGIIFQDRIEFDQDVNDPFE